MRIVRAWSAIARVMAWRIHHVAYVENLIALTVVELLNRTDQADVAFLDQVQQRHPAADVLFRHRNDEAKVRFGQPSGGFFAVPLQIFEVVAKLLLQRGNLLDETVGRRHEFVLAARFLPHLGDEVCGEDVRDGRQVHDVDVRHVFGNLELVDDVLPEVQVHLAVDQSAVLGVGQDSLSTSGS